MTARTLVLLLCCACSGEVLGGLDPDGSAAAPSDSALPGLDAQPSLLDSGLPGADASPVGLDARLPPDAAAPVSDASAPGPDAGLSCAQYAGVTDFTCSADGSSRLKCAAGALVSEDCARGCLRTSAEDACLGTTDSWSCAGSWGTSQAHDGDYFLTAFGCWTDASGTIHTDPGDNCIPGCLSKAQAAGVCHAGESGPACEERITWFVADAGRFGCLAKVRITNPKNGRSVVGQVLDYGPGCSVERSVSKAVLDTSGRIDRQLFGSDQGASDRSLVHVVEVDDATPLGPVP